jgi:hypothetical protein
MLEQQSIMTKNRPEQVAWWLKRGRKPKVVPAIEKPSEFAFAWQQWWLAMQPDWRCRLDDQDKESTTFTRTDPGDTDNTWSNSMLQHAGPIGFHLIIMALAWWGQAINLKDKEDQNTGKFMEAVEDVQWVLKQILNSFPKTKKRSADDDEPSGSNKR